MPDPRTPNAQGYSQDVDGKVTGVMLTHTPNPAARYELIQAALIDERSAQGQTVARVFVKDRNNLDMVATAYLAWPWVGWQPGQQFGNKLKPGNANYPYEHIITNGYNPPNPGPLAIYISEMGDNSGTPASDVIGGIGLPFKHHVSYQLIFRERGAVVTPPTLPPDDDMTEVLAMLDRIEAKVDGIARHFRDV
jgi:hypothetical protein